MWVWLKSTGRRLRIFLKSIRFRLTLWSAGVLAVILVLFSLFIYSRQALDFQVQRRNELEAKAQQIALMYRGAFEHGGPLPTRADLLQPGNGALDSTDALVVVGPAGQVVQQIGPIDQNTAQEIIQAWQSANQGRLPQSGETAGSLGPKNGTQKQYQILITPLSFDRIVYGLMIVAQPFDPTGFLPRLIFTLVLGSLATIALVLAGGYWLAERAMAPVRTITRTARQIGETDLHRRLHINTQDELGEMADTFDAMLDRLQAAFDRQRQFTADASHELRTPLTIVGLETEHTLERRRTNEDYERALRVIQSENLFMSHLVNDLLTLARMDAGQTVVRMESLDLSDVALDVVERLAPLARRDGIELISGEFPEVCVSGDRQYLTQMLTNLVENAIKYAGGAGKHVWVETGCQNGSPKSYAWARVADDGPGIPAEHLQHLFERFYRVDQARARAQDDGDGEKNPGGSGLGLSIVQWIAQAHHGEVTVQSDVGKGTVFEVRLPPI